MVPAPQFKAPQLMVAVCIAPFSVGLGSSPLDPRWAIQAINQSLAGGQKLYLQSARKPKARAKPGTLGWQGLLADPGAGIKSRLPTVGQGGLSSSLLDLSFCWSTVWVALIWWGSRLLINPHKLIHHQVNK